MYIKIKRICETDAPFDLFLDAGNDWTHFQHLHHKSHAEVRLLYKKDLREVFFYKARVLYPLPIYRRFLVVREYVPEQFSYKQVYYDLTNGRIHYLNGRNIKKEKSVVGVAEFWFSVPAFWGLFPQLFAWIFKFRMRSVMKEDNVMIRERIRIGGVASGRCAPPIPDAFNFYEELMGKWPPPAKFEFVDETYENVAKGNGL